MAELAYKSMSIWKELEMDCGTSLRTMSGLLNFGDPTMGEDTPEGSHSRFSVCNKKILNILKERSWDQ